MTDTPVAAQAGHGRGEGVGGEVGTQVGFDGLQGGVAKLDSGAVVGEGGSQGSILEVQS